MASTALSQGTPEIANRREAGARAGPPEGGPASRDRRASSGRATAPGRSAPVGSVGGAASDGVSGAAGASGGGGAAAVGGAVLAAVSEDDMLGTSLLSVSTPPASWTVCQAPTATTTARTSPIQAQIVCSSPRIVRILMIAKIRISVPSSAAVIAVETGSGMLTEASRDDEPGEQHDREQAEDHAREPAPADSKVASTPSSSAIPPTSKSCQGRKRSIRRRTAPTSMICAPRPRALNRSMRPVLSVVACCGFPRDSYPPGHELQPGPRAY